MNLKGPLTLEQFPDVEKLVCSVFEPLGLETHPFHIGWYNEKVGPRFHLDYPDHTVALVVISGPTTFEKCVLPYLKSKSIKAPDFHSTDPLDDSMKYAFKTLEQEIKSGGFDVEMFHDFDLHPSRKPKVLVQTAAHVAGAVEYFHQSRIPQKIREERFSKKQSLFGVAIHPIYGGWFAIRGVLIFPNLSKDDTYVLEKPEPHNLIENEETVWELLEQFAYNWQNNQWREVVPNKSGQRYSKDFQDYLDTTPSERWDFIKSRGFIN